MEYSSIPHMLSRRVSKTPGRRALGHRNGNEVAWLNWKEVKERSDSIAAGLLGLGVQPQDRVSIMATTSVSWILADLGVLSAGGATTTIYPSTSESEAEYIIRDSGSKVAFVEDSAMAAKLDRCDLEHVVVMEGDAGGANQVTLSELEDAGRAALGAEPGMVKAVTDLIMPERLATIIYTSGTTGVPKGVELTHGSWCWQGVAQGGLGLFDSRDLQYLWLPLSHSFGKALLCGILHVGVTTFVDGRVDKISENLTSIRPTLMCAPPRIFEKVYNKAVTTGAGGGGARAKMFTWAVEVGRAKVRLEQGKEAVPLALRAKHKVADKLVLSKLRAKLGGRIRVLVSGSAALSPSIAEFFAGAGLPIMEGYGLTEAGAADFVNRIEDFKIGTVGRAVGDLECRIVDDGEVMLRGATIMRGYHNLPEETAGAIEDGWLHTGDIGELTDGVLTITDRKKELVKTSNGKYVAPSRIEGLFRSLCPVTSQVLVLAQDRNYVTMMITLDPDALKVWAESNALGGDYDQLVKEPKVVELVEEAVASLNTKLERWESVKKFKVLGRELSVEEGELTPSMKVKRRVVEEHFRGEIDEMYPGAVT